MKRLESEIESVAKAAYVEQMKESYQAMLKGLSDEGSKAAKEIADAITKGLNGG